MIQTSVMPDDLSLPMLEQVKQAKDAAVEQLQKQINDIVLELNVLKEQQALQAGKLQIQKSNMKGKKSSVEVVRDRNPDI